MAKRLGVRDQAIWDEFKRRSNVDNAEDYRAIHGEYPEGYRETKDAQLQAAAEAIFAETIGRDAPKFYARDDRYVFDDDSGEGLNPVSLAVARSGPTTPVVIDDGVVYGGELDTDRLGYVDIYRAYGDPQSNASHLGIDPENNIIHRALAFPDQTPIETVEQREAVDVARAMSADDAVAYSAALKRRNVSPEYAKDYLSNFTYGTGPGSRKVLDYLAQAGNSGRDVYLMGGDKRISELKGKEFKDEKSRLLEARKGSLAKQFVDTGGRSANDPTPGLRTPGGGDMEMDHGADYSSSFDATGDTSSYKADDPVNHTWLAREANGQTKNDRSLSDTYGLMRGGAVLNLLGVDALDANKVKDGVRLTGNPLVRDMIDRSLQKAEHGRVLTPGQVKKGLADESNVFADTVSKGVSPANVRELSSEQMEAQKYKDDYVDSIIDGDGRDPGVGHTDRNQGKVTKMVVNTQGGDFNMDSAMKKTRNAS